MLPLHYPQGFAAYGQRLRDTPWSAAMRYAWATLLACIFIKWILPAAWVRALHPLFKVAPLLPFVAKDLAHLPDALARTRAALALRDWRALSVAWLAPELVGLLRLDRAQRRGFLGWLLRRPSPALPPGQAFGYLERSAYGTLIVIVLFATLVELPLDGAIASLFVKDPGRRLWLHLLMLGAGLASLAWALGDRWLVGAGRHVLDGDAFHLRVGARTTGSIPRHAILGCEPLTVARAEWCRRHGVDPRRSLLASPLDKPNTVLILDPDSAVRLTHLGMERGGLSCVFLYLDQPQALASALGKA
ncbi:MAG TPA: hypothetical protein VF793_09500 [Telluria sp.]